MGGEEQAFKITARVGQLFIGSRLVYVLSIDAVHSMKIEARLSLEVLF
jgi:hypothetical protein